MKFIKKLFCKHKYKPIENDYILLGYEECKKCGKHKYTGCNSEFTHFKLPPIRIK